ncbi:MAG TPA: DUF2630 family protein [Acidimicrobiales bacterium]
MDDNEILEHIGGLVSEEHTLLETAGDDGLDEAQESRLASLEANLDQCWDLLRQRRARRHAGLDPDEAKERDTGTVEHYRQ